MKVAVMLLIYFCLYLLGAVLTDLCLRKWKRTEKKAGTLRKFWLIPYTLLNLLPIAGAFFPDSRLKFALAAAGNVWLGFYLYYGGILLILLGVHGLVRLLSRGRLAGLHGGILCVSVLAALLLWITGMVHAQAPRTVTYDITLPGDGSGTEDQTYVLLGDLHLSVNSNPRLMQKMTDLINQEQPDAVVIAGDIFTSTYQGLSHPETYAKILSGIQAKNGVYAVYGNHDVEETLLGGFAISPVSEAFRSDEMTAFFDDCHFITLADETAVLPGGIQLAGRIDGEKAGDGTKDRMTPEELLGGLDPELPIVVLEHEPIEFEALSQAGADLILCGHTHAGQIFPGNLVVPFFNENAWGYERLYGADTIVTAGVGYYGPPMRVGTDSEVTVIHIHFA